MAEFSSVGSIIHEQDFEVCGTSDGEFLESRGEEEFGSLSINKLVILSTLSDPNPHLGMDLWPLNLLLTLLSIPLGRRQLARSLPKSSLSNLTNLFVLFLIIFLQANGAGII